MLTLWTIYDHPRDHPDHYVVRPFTVSAGGGEPKPGDARLFHDIEVARKAMVLMGLTCLHREPNDDPTIVETWV